jgi:hypothetical protein
MGIILCMIISDAHKIYQKIRSFPFMGIIAQSGRNIKKVSLLWILIFAG